MWRANLATEIIDIGKGSLMADMIPKYQPEGSGSSLDLRPELRDVIQASGDASSFDVLLGEIIAISGSEATALLASNPEDQSESQFPKVQIGSLVKMETPYSHVFGLVSGLSVSNSPIELKSNNARHAELELLGERILDSDRKPGRFKRGVSFFPTLADEVYAVTKEELAVVYMYPSEPAVSLGSINQDRTIPAYVVVDELLGKHFAVVGSTGTGKSCAVAALLHGIFSERPNAHIIALDPHGEYAMAFGDKAEVLNLENLRLPYWLMTFEEIAEIILDDPEPFERAMLEEVIIKAKRRYSDGEDYVKEISIDTPIPYRIGDMINILNEKAGNLDNHKETAPFIRLKNRINALQLDTRFRFIFPGLSIRDNMAEIIAQLFRLPVDGKPITLVDLSGVPSEVTNVIVSVLARLTFDFCLWSEQSTPILLVCEEAHRYAPSDTSRGFEPTKRALSRIAKEGRKYGASLCLVTQRPSELAVEMLSQCNTVFALRLTNVNDQEFMRAILSESAIGLMNFLPSLRNGESIAVGEGVPVPMRLSFNELPEEFRPRSGTAKFSEAWMREDDDYSSAESLIDRWRWQWR
jgi:DNA helicase HerA-like ATPase